MSKSAAGGIPILGGLGSSIGGLPLPALAAAAAVGILAVAGKSMVEIGDKWEASQKGLKQATDAAGVSNDKARQFVDQFIGSNTKFVQSQTDVVDSYATLTRAGLQQKEVQRDLNIALDLAALKHISLSEATDLVNKAEHGRMRGLIDLGITSSKYTDVQGNLIVANHSVAKAMDEIEARTKSGRLATSNLTQAQNQLGNAWQSFAARGAPVLLGALTLIFQALNHILEAIGVFIGAIGNAAGAVGSFLNAAAGVGGRETGQRRYRQHGGSVMPGGIYTVGEAGPETFVPSQAGTIIPHGGLRATAAIHVHMEGIYAGDGPSLDILANKIALRLGYASGR